MKNIISNIILLLALVLILGMTLRGQMGNPTEQTFMQESYKTEGPLELSPERGRFVMTFSLLENESFTFTLPLARFATPDVGYLDGEYVSLFAPGVSLVIMPGYIVGKLFGISQVGTYAVIALFAVANFFLIRKISMTLGSPPSIATIAASVFLFATPSFPYAVSLYQHHISVFLLLSGLYLLIRDRSFFSHVLFWILFGVSIIVDYPNAFMMLPLAIFAVTRMVHISMNPIEKITNIIIKIPRTLSVMSIVFPVGFFLWINFLSYDNPLQLAGAVPSVDEIDMLGNPITYGEIQGEEVNLFEYLEVVGKPEVESFFRTRNMLNGFYIHFLSPDRGILYYAPVILIALIGGVLLYKKINYSILIFSIIGVNILLYSMWGDPWGGWAFGSRYLIPTYALSSILLSSILTRYWGSIWFKGIFVLLFSYSIAVNSLGALTTSRVPPQIQVLELESITGREEKYTYERNIDYLQDEGSKSFLYQTIGQQFIPAPAYYFLVLTVIFGFTGTLLLQPVKVSSTDIDRKGGVNA